MYPRNAVRRAPDTEGFLTKLAEACRYVLSTARHLGATEKQLLWDVAKGRYEFTTLRRCLDAASTCSELGAVVAIPEAFRGYAVSQLDERTFPHSVRETYRLNTEDQARGDVAQASMILEPTRPNFDAAIYELTREAESLRLHRDAILRASVRDNGRTLVVVR